MTDPGHHRSILHEISGPIATVTFNRPTQRNSLPAATLELLDRVLSDLFASPEVRSIVFTGTEDVFLSGADIRELSTLGQTEAEAFASRGQSLLGRIAGARQVTIAAINGYCMGGGLDLALHCDLRVASPSTVFAHPGARLGIITGWGGTQRLPRIIGRNRAIELFTAARQLSSAEALKLGLITGIYDPALDGAIEIARGLTTTACSESARFPAGNRRSSWQRR